MHRQMRAFANFGAALFAHYNESLYALIDKILDLQGV